MNPFRSRKKSQAGSDGRPSIEEVPPMPASRGMTFRRKKTQPEPKKEIDISTALPSLNEFRTSLLMPNLSARFSMLRDQDDPNSLIGKANDDSVLFPNRSSRLNFLDPNGLSDIAEVSSLAGSIRPPFAYGRTQSFASNTDGYGTDDDSLNSGSVMQRSKPGAGNKFFGGRQKIYKIPMGSGLSSRDVSTSDGGEEIQRPMGKAVYDDDISLSAFQAMRAKEKLERLENEAAVDDRYSGENDRRASPPLNGYNRNRETGSSTTSAPLDARSSTAATSVASHSASSLYNGANSASTSTQSIATAKQSPLTTPIERPGLKNKRLYGQGLDQHIYENQSSALNRLDTIQRQRGNGTGLLPAKNTLQSKSATNLNDRFQRSQPLYASTNFRAGSPPLTAEPPSITGFDFGVGDDTSPVIGRDNDPAFGRSPPLSPPMSPATDNPTFMAALEPNDLGKATASGVFNKPKTSYNEQQFAQRQLQLQEGRETPPLRAFSRTDVHHDQNGRLRNDSTASMQSGQSSRVYQLSQKSSVQDLAAVHESPKRERPAPFDPYQAANGTFLSGLSGSEEDSTPPSPSIMPVSQPMSQSLHDVAEDMPRSNKYIHDDQHPAFQNRHDDNVYMDLSGEPEPEHDIQDTIAHGNSSSNHAHSSSDVDSPTLGDNKPSGLNGLIRTHLRTDSGQSSIYSNASPQLGRPSTDRDSYSGSHWDKEQWSQNSYGNPTSNPPLDEEEPEPEAPASLSVRAKQILEQATLLRNASAKAEQVLGPVSGDKAQQVLGGEAPRRSNDMTNVPWQEQLKSHHVRGMSSETQKERDDFACELADRRRRVQDNLKSFVDSDSRAPSPALGRGHDSPAKGPGAFGLLRKASKEAVNGRDGGNKAMKMLGINMNGSPNPNGFNISREPSHENLFMEGYDQSRGPNGYVKGMQTTKIPEPARQPSPRTGAGPGQPLKDRSIGAERREKFAARGSPATRSPLLDQPNQGRPAQGRPGLAPSATVTRQQSPNPNGFTGHQLPNPNGFVAKARADITSRDNQAVGYRPAAVSRKYSPPRDTLSTYQPTTTRSRSNSKASPIPPTAQFPPSSSYQSLYPAPINRAPRDAPTAPATLPQINTQAQSYNNAVSTESPINAPTLISSSTFPGTNPISNPRLPASRKRSINKQDISEPTFLSGTSSVTTVDLPPGASLQNGMDEVRAESQAPPVPPFNPRRGRRTQATQNVFTAFGARPKNVEPFPSYSGDDSPPQSRSRKASSPHAQANGINYGPFEERSNFSADEGEPRPKPRTRLRKSSSEGGNMAAKARHQALMKASPAMPNSATFADNEARRATPGMF